MTIEGILQCPVNGSGLHVVDEATIRQVRKRISSGDLLCLNGTESSQAFDRLLKNDLAEIYYPVRDDILILLPAFAIMPEIDRPAYASRVTNSDTLRVMNFYDEIGWTPAASGKFIDAEINEDFRDVSMSYIRNCHLRINNFLPSKGKYLVDIASGPIQYNEYITYSKNFAKRICCDVSFEALRRAKEKLADNGVYVQCDITSMPFKDGSIDAFVSLHTIYHVPEELQIKCFRELERVAGSGASGVVVYSWGEHSWSWILAAPWRAIAAAAGWLRAALHPLVPEAALRWRRRRPRVSDIGWTTPQPITQAASHFCFYAHTFSWYKQNLESGGCWTLHSWRSISLTVLKNRVPDNWFGKAILSVLYRLECMYPATLGRIGEYPMFVFRNVGRSA